MSALGHLQSQCQRSNIVRYAVGPDIKAGNADFISRLHLGLRNAAGVGKVVPPRASLSQCLRFWSGANYKPHQAGSAFYLTIF